MSIWWVRHSALARNPAENAISTRMHGDVVAGEGADNTGNMFWIMLRGQLVYLEIDLDRNGTTDIFNHFEKGVLSYATYYRNEGSTGRTQTVSRREVIYAHSTAQPPDCVVYDLAPMDGEFFHRIRYLSKTNAVREVFEGSRWVVIDNRAWEEPSPILPGSD